MHKGCLGFRRILLPLFLLEYLICLKAWYQLLSFLYQVNIQKLSYWWYVCPLKYFVLEDLNVALSLQQGSSCRCLFPSHIHCHQLSPLVFLHMAMCSMCMEHKYLRCSYRVCHIWLVYWNYIDE